MLSGFTLVHTVSMGCPEGTVGSMCTSFKCNFTVFDFLFWLARVGAPPGGGSGGAPRGGGGTGGPPPGGGGRGGGPKPGIIMGGGGGGTPDAGPLPAPCIPPNLTVLRKFVSSALFKSVKSKSLILSAHHRFFSSSSTVSHSRTF